MSRLYYSNIQEQINVLETYSNIFYGLKKVLAKISYLITNNYSFVMHACKEA